MSLSDARRHAAQAEAFAWYCERHGIEPPEPDMEPETLEDVLAQNAGAWAWARKNWMLFLGEADSADGRFLIELLRMAKKPGKQHRTKPSRRKSGLSTRGA